MHELEALGPYFARWLGSKLWDGEDWYMQVDSHILFAEKWDGVSVEMLKQAPSDKPVISAYPPPHTADLRGKDGKGHIGSRICSGFFSETSIESQIVRLDGSRSYERKIGIPRFAPFMGAGYFIAHSSFLSDVPYDPFMPWIFMGEEISLSARLWTAGYDIFSPSLDVSSHIYGRRHKPKFWEVFNQHYKGEANHNGIAFLVMQRIKNVLGYPESAEGMVFPRTILDFVDLYGMGKERPLADFWKMVGLDPITKGEQKIPNNWCKKGMPPPNHPDYE